METIKWLFDKNTRHGRGLRTALQALFGVLTFITGLVAIPGLGALLADNNIVTVTTFATWVGVISYVQNWLEDAIKELD